MLSRTLPHDAAAERAFLGGVLITDNEELRERALEHVPAGAFYSASNRDVFEAIRAVHREGSAPDVVTVVHELERRGILNRIGGPAYLASLLEGVPRSANVLHYGALIVRTAQRRQIIAGASELISLASNGTPDEDLATVLSSWSERFASVGRHGALLAAEDLVEILGRPVPETPWAVEGLLAEGDVALLTGRGAVGKTWLSLAIALAMASGQPVFGHYAVSRAYRVAFVDLESRPWEVDQRLQRIAAGLGIQPETIAAGQGRILRERLRLDDAAGRARLLASLSAWGTEFVFLDSFRRTHTGNENASEIISGLFQECFDRIRLELGCGVVVVDHLRKKAGDASLDTPEESIRGSTDKRNMCDAHFGVEKRDDNRLAFTPTKTRHCREPEGILIALSGLDDEGGGPVFVTHAGSVDKASDAVQDRILAVLEEPRSDDGMVARGEILGRCKPYSTRAVSDGLAALKRRRLVRHERRAKQAFYGLLGGTCATSADECTRLPFDPTTSAPVPYGKTAHVTGAE